MSFRTRGLARRSRWAAADRKSTRLNSSHGYISYAVFCLKKKILAQNRQQRTGLSRIGSVGKAPGSAQRLDVEKTQCCQTLPYRDRRFSFPKQLRLIFATVSRA